MLRLIILVTAILGLAGCDQAHPSIGPASASAPAATPASAPAESVPCKYRMCSEGARLYWFNEPQKDSLNGDTDWWQGSQAGEFENGTGHPTLVVGCRASRFIQAQIKTGVILESSDSVTNVPAKADGKRTAFNWPVAKDYETIILDKSQFRSLSRNQNLILGLEDYHGFTHNMVLQIAPFSPEMKKSCSL